MAISEIVVNVCDMGTKVASCLILGILHNFSQCKNLEIGKTYHVVKVSWHKAASPLQPCTDRSIIFTRWRRCAWTLDPRTFALEWHLNRFSRFCRGGTKNPTVLYLLVGWTPPQVSLLVEGICPRIIHGSLGPHDFTSQTHLERLTIFTGLSSREKQTNPDHTIPLCSLKSTLITFLSVMRNLFTTKLKLNFKLFN